MDKNKIFIIIIMPPKKNPITKKKGRVATPPRERRAPAPPPSPQSSPKAAKKQPIMQSAAEALSQAHYVGQAPGTGHAVYAIPPSQVAAAGGYMDMSRRFGKKTPPPRRKATDKLPTPPPKRKEGKK